jgi:hypothetical protein
MAWYSRLFGGPGAFDSKSLPANADALGVPYCDRDEQRRYQRDWIAARRRTWLVCRSNGLGPD